MHYSILKVLLKQLEECFLLAKRWQINYINGTLTFLFPNSSYLQSKLKWDSSNLYKKTLPFLCVCVCVRLIGRLVLLFLYFFMPSNPSTCQNWNGCTVLTLTKSKEKLFEVLRQYYTSVKRPVLSKGWGFKLSQHLNSCWLEKKMVDEGIKMLRELTGSAASSPNAYGFGYLCSKSALIWLSCVTWDETAVKTHKLWEWAVGASSGISVPFVWKLYLTSGPCPRSTCEFCCSCASPRYCTLLSPTWHRWPGFLVWHCHQGCGWQSQGCWLTLVTATNPLLFLHAYSVMVSLGGRAAALPACCDFQFLARLSMQSSIGLLFPVSRKLICWISGFVEHWI